MIQYTLKCTDGHQFDSWFKSADAFETLQTGGLILCPICGGDQVSKAIMAPRVATSRQAQIEKPRAPADQKNLHALSAPASEAEAAMVELKKKIQDSSEYVGTGFAEEARKIHDGDAQERSIYGEANPEDARKLIEDGVPVAPLPFIPTRKTN